MKDFRIKFTFQGKNYFLPVQAESEYGALVAFEREIRSKIVVSSVEEQKPSTDQVDELLSIFGMKKK